MLGKPAEHVTQALRKYVDQMKTDEKYTVRELQISPPREQEGGLWATFAEVEVGTSRLSYITDFCLDYMPSLIEIMEPQELVLKDVEFSQFLNDLQAKLHTVDLVAKQVKLENDFLKKNMGGLLKNYITVLLSKQNLTAVELSSLTGVNSDKLADYLDQLIDEGKVDLKGDIYYLPLKKELVPNGKRKHG